MTGSSVSQNNAPNLNTSYVYNDNGALVSQTTGSTTTTYLIDYNNPTGYSQTLEEHVNGATTPKVTYFIGNDVIGQANGSTVIFLIKDGHGNTRVLTNAAGTFLVKYDYNAFGNALNFSASTALTSHLLADGVYNSANNFQYQRARWRNGFVFTQRDSEGYGSSADPISLPQNKCLENLHLIAQ